MDYTHCLSPARAREADAAVTSRSYARLFPDLPAFTADEAFLYALGRAGLCDCGDAEDDEASLGTAAESLKAHLENAPEEKDTD